MNDTVHSYNEATGEGNGFTFRDYNAHDMMHTLRRAVSLYHQPEHWKRVTRNAFAGDYSWDVSAEQYTAIYRDLIQPAVSEADPDVAVEEG
ncbi:Glycogen synthase [compost metagenome]